MTAVEVIRANLDYLLLGSWPVGPLGGMALSVVIGLTAALLASLLGLAGGITMTIGHPLLRRLVALPAALLRAIPVVMLIFWCYFLLPVLFAIDVPGTLTVIAALALIGGAFLTQAVHAGIAAIGAGQWQAGLSLGFSRWQTLRLIVLPQALRIMVPSFVNQWITLVKDTSLAYIVGVAELTFVASQVNNREQVYPLPVFATVALLYWLWCSGLVWLGARWEAHYAGVGRK